MDNCEDLIQPAACDENSGQCHLMRSDFFKQPTEMGEEQRQAVLWSMAVE